MDLGGWLRNLGLEQYEAAFRENAIDETVLPNLTPDDLKDLGVGIVGHRRRLLDAIAALHAKVDAKNVPSTTVGATGRALNDTAERRQLTVMFCDLVGSTALAVRLDPEDLREIIAAYHRRVAKAVARYEGFIAKHMGDGVLVYFGYPLAHEDDAERAVRAGLKLAGTMDRVRVRADIEPLQVRIGIATGLVVVGDLIGSGEAQERGIVGETPNLASRLQALAPPGGVVIAADTHRLTGGLFEYENLGAIEVKGFNEAVQAWRVLRASRVASRFDAFHSSDLLTPLVGRDEEVDLLLRRWRQARNGEGQVVLLSGEPGIGKSRLTDAMQDRLSTEPHLRLPYFCSPHHQASALFPFINQLERAADFERDDSTERKLEKIERLLARSTGTNARDAAVLAELLSVPNEGRYAPLDLQPQKRKEIILATLLAQLESFAARRPLLVIFEDAHWIDPTSRELLDLVVARVGRLPVLLLITFRPEFEAPWVDQPNVTLLALNRLGRRQGTALVQQLAGSNRAALPQKLIDEIVERTDGVPLFVEEMTKAVLEAGGSAISGMAAPQLAIPPTLHASLLARLDRLGPSAKATAQLGAAIGREFSFDLLQSLGWLSEPELLEALRLLVDAGLVFQRGAPPWSRYLFKHALVQDMAYSTLLRGPRQALHMRIARALEERFTTVADTQPEILAHHFVEGGLLDRSVTYSLRAGKNAAARSANIEAISNLRQGIESMSGIPEGAGKDRLELDLQFALGPCLIATRGATSTDAVNTFTRARELCRRLGDPTEYPQVMHWLTVMHAQRGELSEALDTATTAVALAETRGDRPAVVNSTRGQGLILLMLGRLPRARQAIDYNMTQFQACNEAEKLATRVAGQDAGSAGLAVMSWTLWMLGHVDLASERMNAALQRAEAIGHPHTQAYTCYYASVFHALRHAPEIARAHAERCMALSEEHGFGHWRMLSSAVQGISANLCDPNVDTLVTVRRELAGHAGYQIGITALYMLLSEALVARGELTSAAEIISKGLAIADRTGERIFEAELLRLQARTLMVEGAPLPADALAALEKALTIASSQHARPFELRAARDLAVLWCDHGRLEEARRLLAPICDGFTEGLDTADLMEARTLIEKLQ